MPRKQILLTTFLVLTIAILSSGQTKEAQKKIQVWSQNAEAIARTASEGVGRVGKVSKGTKGAPIMILEERHDSRTGQIQHAITLVRLHDQYGLRHIALEGYLRERQDIETEWFTSAARGNSEAKARVAVRLLKEGEISGAEFMKLVYDDVFIHPIETISEYSVELGEDAARSPLLYLLNIAQQSLRQEHAPKLRQLQGEIEKLNGEKKQKKQKEMLDYILSADLWAQTKAKTLQDRHATGNMSAEQLLSLMEEIENRAKELSIAFQPDEKKAMEHNLEFWRGRCAASKTMILSTGEIADQEDVSIVAMSIGAAHTEGMCDMLSDVDRPFAVVTPLSLRNPKVKDDLSWDMFERKYERLSVYSDGFTATLLKAFPRPRHKKPEPVLSETWFQGKAEIYLFTDRIAHNILVPQNPPGGGKPPYGFSDDAFTGRWVYADPKRISIIPDDTKNNKGRAVLFPIVLNRDNPEKRTEIWVKAGLDVAILPEQERESVESMLKKALEDTQSEGELSTKVEDKSGRIQITLNTIATYARTQEEATKVVLHAI